MNKTSGQDNISPPEEKIEIIATGMIGSVLAAMEKKILQAIEDYEPPVPGAVKQPTKEQMGKNAKLDAINAKKLDDYRKIREARHGG